VVEKLITGKTVTRGNGGAKAALKGVKPLINEAAEKWQKSQEAMENLLWRRFLRG
jgi:hypothetical protein